MNRGINITVKNGRRVVEGIGYYKPKEAGDLRELVKGSAVQYGSKIGFKFKDRSGRITGKTYQEFDRDIDRLGTALIGMGLKEARIAIISENRYEWGVCYFSVVNGTGVAVPMDKYLPKNEVENLILRGSVEAIFYSPTYHGMMKDIAAADSSIRCYICMENINAPGENDVRFAELPALLEKGEKMLADGDRSFINAPIDKKRMSMLLFTSGTTSISKGVMLSHSNIVTNVSAVTTVVRVYPDDVHLSLLPLHHTLENSIGLVFMIHNGVCIAYSDGIKHIAQNLKEYNVTLLIVVPAIFEAMYRKLQEGIRKAGKEKQFNILGRVSGVLRFFGIDIRRKLFKNVFMQLGPSLRLAISGAAPLDPELVRGFDRIGLSLLQGYGLTETSPVVAANNDFVNKPGTIGHPLAGVEVAVDSPDENGMGELIVRGGNVMLGYYKDEKATAQAIDSEGWFRTGDLGIIDESGFIRITGRAKSMIVFTNGKKAFPEEYEVLLNNIPGVKDSFVWGNRAADGDIQVCAKLVVDAEKLAAENGSVLSEEELALRFNAAIRELNKSIPQYKIIRYFVMTREELTITTTLKIKRPVEYAKTREMLDNAGMDMRKATGRFIEDIVK